MSRRKKNIEAAAAALESLMPSAVEPAASTDAPASETKAVEEAIATPDAEGGAESQAAAAEIPAPSLDAPAAEPEAPPSEDRLLSIIESLLFAADRPLSASDIRRAVGARSDKSIREAVALLTERRAATGLQVVSVAGAYRLQTHPDNQRWVQKLVAGRPVRLSRAMLETLAIVAYRQPVTRPEIDDIRGVDCGPVLKTLLDRQLVRVIGKKEEVGRPMLYGTTPEFLTTFNIHELVNLPTLRDFHELGEEDQALVDATHGEAAAGPFAGATEGAPLLQRPVAMSEASPDDEENDSLLEQLDHATSAATRALAAAGKDVDGEGLAAAAAEPTDGAHPES